MKKINDEYTFSEALEKVIEEGKRLNNPTYDRLLKRYVSLAKSYNKLLKDYKVLIRYSNTLESVNKKLKAGESYPDWKLTKENENENLTNENTQLKQKDVESDKKVLKLTEENKTLNTEIDKLTKENEKLTKQITEEKAKNDNLTKENEILCEKLVETSENALKLAEKYEPLNQTVVLREKEIEILIEYIKSLKSRLNNQEDDDKVYPEYHTHDTFKVHNKLAEVVNVLVDKDDDVYGYEIKFEDSDDTFIVYPEEIDD